MIELLKSAGLILFGFVLHGWADSRRENRQVHSQIDALGMEVRRCGKLAATYLHDNVQAPLYRLPSDAYRIALPSLLAMGLLSGKHADTLQRFYLQVEQMNRGLDNVDDFLRGKTPEKSGQAITLEEELKRLRDKARGLRAVGHGEDASDLYKEAFGAFEGSMSLWRERSWWRRFKKKGLRPTQERLKQLWQRTPWSN